MRLAPAVFDTAPRYMAAIGDVTLDLTNLRVSTLDNMATWPTDYESIDLSHNLITRLRIFPPMARLKTLYLSDNLIADADEGWAKSVSSTLSTIRMCRNRVSSFSALHRILGPNPARIETLSLHANPITGVQHYREWVIYMCPNLRVLDWQKVTSKLRAEANRVFATISADPADMDTMTRGEQDAELERRMAEEKVNEMARLAKREQQLQAQRERKAKGISEETTAPTPHTMPIPRPPMPAAAPSAPELVSSIPGMAATTAPIIPPMPKPVGMTLPGTAEVAQPVLPSGPSLPGSATLPSSSVKGPSLPGMSEETTPAEPVEARPPPTQESIDDLMMPVRSFRSNRPAEPAPSTLAPGQTALPPGAQKRGPSDEEASAPTGPAAKKAC
ncbi:hypothetical protein KIPB_007588 [Kipferlia bialata]|uniref:Uncharacterized protein n=1 Tax=Kipferlia bialata TaxID=797122 RepID=A0A9K3D1Z9_9EUKA|nr:hypothetical protein KIPB_007588 [Kipferlia bialata]|eukprot:g7588.t1